METKDAPPPAADPKTPEEQRRALELAVRRAERGDAAPEDVKLLGMTCRTFLAKIDQEGNIFPSLTNDGGQKVPGGYHFDRVHQAFWIGLYLPMMDYHGALAFLHSMEFNLWSIFDQMRKQAALLKGAPPEPKKGWADRILGK